MPKHLNIWWVSHYASTPDQQYTAQFDLAKKLVEKGHRVTFFAAGFSHYKFQELRLKDGETWREEECEGVKFVWIRTWPYRANNWRRAYNMLSFALRAYWVASRKRADAPDLIIGTTFHPLSSLSGYFLSIAKGTPFVFEVRDLWPLTMVEFGRFSRFNPLALVLAALEKFLARRASRIMTTLPRAADYYVELGITREKIVWIPNGLDLSRYSDLKAYEGNLHDPCVLLYAGGHVSANALDTIIRAARIQQDRNNSVKFVFVGGGQEKTKLIRLATELNLKNIEFRDVVPKRELRHIMEQADAFILSMRNLPRLYRYGMSFNKLCDYVSSGRPVLFAGNPGANVVEEFQCGIVVSPEDPVAFAAAIEEFTSMSVERRVEMGRNGIRCARERFDIAAIGGRLEAMLISLMRDAPLGDEAVGKLSRLKAS